MTYNLKAAVAAAAKSGPDMNEAQAFGGQDVPAAGVARARFVGYFEVGKFDEDFQGQIKTREKVLLVFELSGPRHPPREFDGEKTPQRITVVESFGLTEKSNFLKLFRQMNYGGKATHIAQLLGEPYMVEVFHRPGKDGKKTFARLKGPNGYNIRGTTVQDPVSGSMITVEVAPPMTRIKAFLWNQASKEMWDSIFIEGEYPEKRDEKTGEVLSPAKSKNVLQNRIRSAKNFAEIADIVEANAAPDLPDPETPARAWFAGDDAADPLAHIG